MRSNYYNKKWLLLLSLTIILSVILIRWGNKNLKVEAAIQMGPQSAEGIWQELAESKAASNARQRTRLNQQLPHRYRSFQLNQTRLAEVLRQVPMEYSADAREKQIIVSLPLPNGTFSRFRVEESPVMEPEQAAKYPEMKSYRGFGIDDPLATMRFSLTPRGVNALILSPGSDVTIQPAVIGNTTDYISFFGQDTIEQGNQFSCEVREPGTNPAQQYRRSGFARTMDFPVGATLRTYRIAIATTQEFSNASALGGGTLAGVNAALVVYLNSINAMYERELSIHLNLAAGNDNAIKFAEPDGYTNGTNGTMLDEVRNVLPNDVSLNNYDVGHVLGTGGGGVAYIQAVCNSSSQAGFGPYKSGGVSSVSSAGPAGTGASTMMHELGHQFGAGHTFNAKDDATNCSTGNRSSTSAWEPGSGFTIMSYGGLCSTHNTQAGQDLRFHSGSFTQITNYIGTLSCATTSATGNNIPTVNGGNDYTIPRNTPFTLSAIGSDADIADVPNLTYCWEEYDSGGTTYFNPPYSDSGDPGTTTRPIFRAFSPTQISSRTFPSLTYILNNANVPPATNTDGFQTAESLSNISRSLNFRVSVRDNRGGVNYDSVLLTVNAGAGPFQVTQPNVATTWTGNGTQTVTWSVNNTNTAPINCTNVRILLSVDGGQTFPIVLLSSTANDGSETVTVPNGYSSTQARVKVEAIGNIFFDISDTNFTITPGDSCPAVSSISPQIGLVGSSVVITGTGFTGVTGVKFANNLSASFTVNSNTQITATVPAGAVSGRLTISKSGCPDQLTSPFSVSASCTQLVIDDGSMESAVGYGSGTLAYFVNRLTPTSYPATLSSVTINFHSSFPVGSNFTVVVGNNADGDSDINGTIFQQTAATVTAVNGFSTYTIPDYTITSGDFVVGFSYVPATNVFPIRVDTTAPYQNRSYSAVVGSSYFQETARDYGIRGNYCAGAAGCPTITSISPSSGVSGATVTINGSNFSGITAVKFNNNVSAVFTVLNNTQIQATVPAGAISGVLTVNKSGCSGTNSSAFSVITPLILANAANYSSTEAAADSIVLASHSGIANSLLAAPGSSLPSSLNGASVNVQDSANVTRAAGLFFVAPDRLNFLMPAATAAGTATVTLTNATGSFSGTISVASVSPAFFSADSTGSGIVKGYILRVSGSVQTTELIARFDPSTRQWIAIPINLGPPTDQVTLVLQGTGFRNRSSLAAVTVLINGTSVSVVSAGAAASPPGFDELKVSLPQSLAGAGLVNIAATINGKAANTVKISIQ